MEKLIEKLEEEIKSALNSAEELTEKENPEGAEEWLTKASAWEEVIKWIKEIQ